MTLIEDYQSGVGLKKLEKKYGIGWREIRKQITDAGVEVKAKSTQRFNTADAISRYQAGGTLSSLSKHYGVAENALKERFKRANFKCRSINKYQYDLSLLTDLSSEIGAYWYGFLLADGHITSGRRGKKRRYARTLKVTLSWRDHNHLIKLCDALRTKKKPIFRFRFNKQRNKIYKVAEIQINNRELCDFYINKGWDRFKASEPILPPELNIRHFLRGLWDGDGCISSRSYKNKRYLLMSYADMSFDIGQLIHDEIVKITDARVKKIRQLKSRNDLLSGLSPMFGFQWNGRPATRIAYILYKDQSIVLDRKLAKLQKLGLTI